MIHRWKISLALLLLILVGGIIYAQVPFGGSDGNDLPHRDEKTGQLLALAQKLYEEMSLPDAGSTCRLSCRVEVVSRGPGDSLYTKKNDLRYTGNAHCIGIESSDMSLYQDSTVGLAVAPSRKEIRIFPSSSAQLEKTRQESMKTFRDELFTKSSLEKDEVNGKEHRLILLPSKDFSEWYGIERVTIALVPEERRLVSIDATFGKRGNYESMRMEYGRLECSEHPDETNAPALDKVFDSSGHLRSDYSDYTVIDLRSK